MSESVTNMDTGTADMAGSIAAAAHDVVPAAEGVADPPARGANVTHGTGHRVARVRNVSDGIANVSRCTRVGREVLIAPAARRD